MQKLQIINNNMLDAVSAKAKDSERQRINHNFHADYDDPINRMLNALEPSTYIQPHKHEQPDKREVFIVLKGSFMVYLFNNEGEVTQMVKLSQSDGCYGVDIPAGIWHTLVCLESGSVAYEIKDGPYEKMKDKNFASWAPKEGEAGCQAYLHELLAKNM